MGDTVKHIKFGTGVVKSIVDGGRDYEVTVDFEKAGVKKDVCLLCKIKEIITLFQKCKKIKGTNMGKEKIVKFT